MAPNATRLIVAPEDELKFGKELGAGAFGTVYEVREKQIAVGEDYVKPHT